MQKLQGLKPEDRQKEMMSHHEKLAKLLQKTLKPDQAKRLQQIEFQMARRPLCDRSPQNRERPEDHGRATEAIHGCDPGHAKEDSNP